MDDLVPPEDLPDSPAAAPAIGAHPPAPSDPASDVVPDGDLPDNLAAAPAASPDAPTTSTLGASLEGAAKGLIGPLAPAAELGLSKLGVPYLSAEEQTKRSEEHPYAEGISEAGTLLGSALIPGLGEYTIGSKIAGVGAGAAATAKALEIGKVGQTALKLAVEGGVFHMADNASKMILGQTDPTAPVAALFAGTPAAAVLGGGLGYLGGKAANKLQEIASSKSGSAAAQWLADFGSRYGVRSTAGDVGQTAADEAQHLYDTTSAAINDGFQLKRDSVEKLTSAIDPGQTRAYVNGLEATLSNLPRSLTNSDAAQDAIGAWRKAVNSTTDIIGGPSYTPSSADVFEATDSLKRQLGKLAKFDSPQFGSADQAMGNAAGSLYHNLRTSLENPGMWGEMGNFQKQLNSAYSELQDPLKFFTKTAVKQTAEGAKVDPDVMSGLFKQLGKGKGSLRSDKIAQFLDPARSMLDTVDQLHTSLGLESSIPKVATPTLNEMLQKEVPAGAKFADWLFDRGPGAIGWAGGHAVGTAVGAIAQHPYLGYRAGEHLAPLLKNMGERPTNWAVSGALRALSGGDPAGIAESVGYSKAIAKGATSIENGVNNLFAVGGKQYLNSDHSDKDREKLRQYVDDGSQNQQLQNTAAPAAAPPEKFAKGGEVLAPEPTAPTREPVGGVLDGMKKVSATFPEQATVLGAAKGRINNYLNQVRPQKMKSKLPFDEEMPNPEHERSYDKALDIANKPLSVLDHIKGGTLEPEHMQHMAGLHPELLKHLQGKISDKIVEGQMKNEKPPHKVQQGLSMFMGSDLDSNLTPQNIQAAQAVFQAQGMQQSGGMGKPKRGTGELDKAPGQYRTAEQSAQARQSYSKP